MSPRHRSSSRRHMSRKELKRLARQIDLRDILDESDSEYYSDTDSDSDDGLPRVRVSSHGSSHRHRSSRHRSSRHRSSRHRSSRHRSGRHRSRRHRRRNDDDDDLYGDDLVWTPYVETVDPYGNRSYSQYVGGYSGAQLGYAPPATPGISYANGYVPQQNVISSGAPIGSFPQAAPNYNYVQPVQTAAMPGQPNVINSVAPMGAYSPVTPAYNYVQPVQQVGQPNVISSMAPIGTFPPAAPNYSYVQPVQTGAMLSQGVPQVGVQAVGGAPVAQPQQSSSSWWGSS